MNKLLFFPRETTINDIHKHVVSGRWSEILTKPFEGNDYFLTNHFWAYNNLHNFFRRIIIDHLSLELEHLFGVLPNQSICSTHLPRRCQLVLLGDDPGTFYFSEIYSSPCESLIGPKLVPYKLDDVLNRFIGKPRKLYSRTFFSRVLTKIPEWLFSYSGDYFSSLLKLWMIWNRQK